MSMLMAGIRLVIQTDEELREAIRVAAYRRGSDMSTVANEILRAGLTAEELQEARKRIKQRRGEERS